MESKPTLLERFNNLGLDGGPLDNDELIILRERLIHACDSLWLLCSDARYATTIADLNRFIGAVDSCISARGMNIRDRSPTGRGS